ncbi:hypothetical protein GCM10028806_27960 [Spirosoma terrae]|uniref:Uncharacterized protein n=1 Tax=Spirosoma terrae TaxID=1968276 RepID=A0A6L9LDM6_9BACT|nr:hypothetical protein [Spirosoma terrae]NDU97241.1 hypothetical protein [Spirosoma terrae]
MKQTGNGKRQKNQATVIAGNIANVMNCWCQAVSTFHAMYATLELACHQSQDKSIEAPYPINKPYNARVLDYVRNSVVQELEMLCIDIDEPQHHESEKELIEHLQAHTWRLQKHIDRIQWALSISGISISR